VRPERISQILRPVVVVVIELRDESRIGGVHCVVQTRPQLLLLRPTYHPPAKCQVIETAHRGLDVDLVITSGVGDEDELSISMRLDGNPRDDIIEKVRS
jgi:hypothetical protein